MIVEFTSVGLVLKTLRINLSLVLSKLNLNWVAAVVRGVDAPDWKFTTKSPSVWDIMSRQPEGDDVPASPT